MVQLKKVLSGEIKLKQELTFPGAGVMLEPDVNIITSCGLRIPAHSKILASASPVLEIIVQRPQKRQCSERKIPILGVPYDAVSVFLQFLYSSKCGEDQMEKYGVHLLALSHVYIVPQLKQICSKGLSQRLNVENVVDMLQLARLCDTPDLYLKCMRSLSDNFKAVEKTEGWKFLKNNDPYLELEILQFFDETDTRKKRTRRRRSEQNLYLQLGEAMDCLEHICTEGCTSVGPYNMDPCKQKSPCTMYSTCNGLQLLMKHFGTCKKRANGGCSHCKRMWQLFRLHSSICDQPDECQVPLCRQFKLKVNQVRRGNDAQWRLLVKKVVSAKTISSLSLPERKREEPMKTPVDRHHHQCFKLS